MCFSFLAIEARNVTMAALRLLFGASYSAANSAIKNKPRIAPIVNYCQ